MGLDGIRKSINGISVVERLSSKFLTWVVEVQFDLVGRRSNRFITCELKLFKEVFVRVLGHLSTFIGIKEDVVNVKRGSNEGLLVSLGDGLLSSIGGKCAYSPETFTNRSQVKVNLDFVVLKGNKRKGKSRVSAVPEAKRNVKSGFRKSVTRSAYLGRSSGSGTRSIDTIEVRVGDVCKLSGVTNHLVVTLLLFRRKGKFVPDVHPVTILTVDSLTSDFDFNLGYKLFTNVIQPTGIDSVSRVHGLVDFRKGYLKVSSVGKITISGDCASDTATEIGLSRESLFDRFHSKVCVSSVRDLPEG